MPIENYLVHPKMRIKGLQDTHMPIENYPVHPKMRIKGLCNYNPRKDSRNTSSFPDQRIESQIWEHIG